MFCKRRIYKIFRWTYGKAVPVALFCFCLGVIFGWNSHSGNIQTLQRIVDHDHPVKDVERLDREESDRTAVLGRKKLSIKSEREQPVFTRLPANFEKNVFPPRAPSEKFTMEPTRVIARNRANDKGRSHYFMLFIVKSSPIHMNRREVIRKTWGAVKVVDGLLLNTIFVVGNVGKNQPIQDMLAKENDNHGDLLQIDAMEGYRNLPSKVLSAMEWLISKSSDISSDFYTFTDDDCVMNIANIADFFAELPFVDEENEPKRTVRNSAAPLSVKKIQSIELHEKRKVNEVTLSHLDIMNREDAPQLKENEQMKEFERQRKPVELADSKSESDQDLKENLEIYEEIDSNSKIQIERTGGEDDEKIVLSRDDAELFAILKSANQIQSLNESLTNFNPAYKQNALNLTDYIRESLSRDDDPSAIFRSRRLSPDTIYCGFSFDPRGQPHRRLKSKWAVTKEVYSEEVYPTFCHGGMYTMSGTRMSSIYAISTVTDWKLFHLEDVLITGILREKTGVPESKFIRRATDPKKLPLMYYAWDSGPRVMLKMTRKWKFFTRKLLTKRFIMEATKEGRVVSWNNYGRGP